MKKLFSVFSLLLLFYFFSFLFLFSFLLLLIVRTWWNVIRTRPPIKWEEVIIILCHIYILEVTILLTLLLPSSSTSSTQSFSGLYSYISNHGSFTIVFERKRPGKGMLRHANWFSYIRVYIYITSKSSGLMVCIISYNTQKHTATHNV